MKMLKKIDVYLKKTVTLMVYDDSRKKIAFVGLNAVLVLVSLIMSVVNIFTAEYILMISTLVFSLGCGLNIVLYRAKVNVSVIYAIFAAEAMTLLAFFFVSGIPDGFSALWICLIPSFALLIFGRKDGGIFCLIALMMIIFLFWIPAGKALLQYTYSDTFMLRFPFLYSAIFIISFLAEIVRRETHKQLVDSERKYRYLYRHDALTGLFNRYGINEYMDEAFHNPADKHAAIMILDIENFKRVNDRYGHNAGDQVLKTVAQIPQHLLCEHSRYCRWGGEEFLILMQCSHDPLEMAEKVRKKVEETEISYEGNTIKVTISIGVCLTKDVSRFTIPQVINSADNCLYEAKGNGKNQVRSCLLE